MNYSEFIEAIKKVPHQEMRLDTSHLMEFVLKRENLESFIELIEKFFGKPLKPAGAKPTPESLLLAKPYGGVWDDQILYCHQSEAEVACVLIWPWQSGDLLTVKIGRRKPEGGSASAKEGTWERLRKNLQWE